MPPLWRASHHTAAQGAHAHEGHLQVEFLSIASFSLNQHILSGHNADSAYSVRDPADPTGNQAIPPWFSGSSHCEFADSV